MARRRKRTLTQQMTGAAWKQATGSLPPPLRWLVQSRMGTAVALLIVGGLTSLGVIQIDWNGWTPQVHVDRTKVEQLKEQAIEKLENRVANSSMGSNPNTSAAIVETARKTLDKIVPPATGTSTAATVSRTSPANRDPSRIRIASFNIQVFGTSKLADTNAMRVIVDIVRQCDVVAIQELRSRDDSVMPQFLQMINSDGSRYDFVAGPRLGRTSSKEQYVYVFDTSRIERDMGVLYTLNDPQDLMHREPFVARFRARTTPPDRGFSFTLINVHTDPDEARQEVDVLADAFRVVQQDGSGEDDVILLGDLNVDDRNLGRLGSLPGMVHVIAGVPTNTRRNRTYDNLLFEQSATREYTGAAGVLDLQQAYSLTLEQALKVSDHSPVWAEFSAYEAWQ